MERACRGARSGGRRAPLTAPVLSPHTARPDPVRDPAACDPPVGIQVVIAGSAEDAFFGPFRDALIREPALLAEYNQLKQSLDGADYDRYTSVKGEFVERVLDAINDAR